MMYFQQTGLDEDSLVYLDASLSMPLYSQVVEQSIAINKQLQPSAPSHIMMTIEWKHANWYLFNQDCKCLDIRARARV